MESKPWMFVDSIVNSGVFGLACFTAYHLTLEFGKTLQAQFLAVRELITYGLIYQVH
jgi:hypothetical protein